MWKDTATSMLLVQNKNAKSINMKEVKDKPLGFGS